MQNSKLKNSIILRGMASNVVDEAIVILKPNIKIKKLEHSKNLQLQEHNYSKDFIVKEAENVIIEYINKIKILKVTNIMFFVILLTTIILKINGF